jgi:hypothetical protein
MTLIAELMIEWCTKHEWIPMSNTQPKLIFKQLNSDPLALHFGMEYAPGTFTPTGIRSEHTDPLIEWCTKHSCGTVDLSRHKIVFHDESDMVWFLLVWS